MNWREAQSEFARAVRDPALDVPNAVGPRINAAPLARFNVYRNNSNVSLTEAIGDGFPVVRQLVGDDFFNAMARAYVAEHLPSSPVMIEFGHAFPDFIGNFEPARDLPFLADVARVEWSWSRAYHAKDCNSITVEPLQAIAPERLERAQLTLHPSLQLVQSDFPAVSIWSAHQIEDDDTRQAALQNLEEATQYGLIIRPEFEVNVQLLDAAVWRLLAAFRNGATLGEASNQLDQADLEQFGGMLAYVFSIGAVTAIQQN
jgi:hypothetical protein